MATYTVKGGDSLSKIARDVLNNMELWPQIASLNNIRPPYTIFPGQVLTLPAISDEELYKGGAARGVPLPVPTTQTPPAIEGGMIPRVNWTLISLAIIGAGLLWYGFRK